MTTLIEVLGALAAGDRDGARALAVRAAATHPRSALATALAPYLNRPPASGVYDEPHAFEAFIDNGGNVGLYRATIQQLAAVHAADLPRTVLDIGCGDGRVTAAVLGAEATHVDLVEPSAELLHTARAAVARTGVAVAAHHLDASGYLAALAPAARWDLVQSTFAMHATAPAERPVIVRELARRARRVLIAEFDVPRFEDRSAAHVAYLADRYERGVREYRAHPEVVAGFLLPVLVGQLDPTRPRYTFEQPIAAWQQQLHDAGFTTRTHLLDRYWWADAVLIDCRGPGC